MTPLEKALKEADECQEKTLDNWIGTPKIESAVNEMASEAKRIIRKLAEGMEKEMTIRLGEDIYGRIRPHDSPRSE